MFFKNQCGEFHHFKICLSNYNEDGKCLLNEAQRKLYIFLCPKCKTVTFLNFEQIANEVTVICLKNRQNGKIETKNKRRENALGGIKRD